MIFGAMLFQAIQQSPQIPERNEQEQFIEDMKVDVLEAYATTHVRPSIVMAQAILESNWGKSQLSVEANNYFGIKGSYQGQTYAVITHEYDANNKPYNITDNFRKYPNRYTSILDHGELLRTQGYQAVIEAKTYQKSAQALQSLGYATDPNYAQKLINLIETYDLHTLDPK